MTTFDAKICEEGSVGAFYNVRLVCLPRVGDRISLHSFVDAKDGHHPFHNYEVSRVFHDIHDLPKDDPRFADGHHEVTVFVIDLSKTQPG